MAPGQFNLADVALYGGVKTAEEIPAEYKYDTSLKDVPIYLSLKESRVTVKTRLNALNNLFID